MAARKALVTSVLLHTCLKAQAAYPTEYPFDNESLVPPPIVAAIPSLTYDDSDPGGYIYHYGYARTEIVVPTNFWNGQIAHMQASYDVTPFYEPSNFNCTGKGRGIIDADSFLSTLAGEEVCKPGECCQMLWGQFSYLASTVSAGDYDWEGSLLTDGLCDGVYPEEVFCTIFDRYHTSMCVEYVLTETERSTVGPCMDYLHRYWMDCTLYKNTGVEWDRFLEPESYWEKNTPEEMNAHYSCFRRADKVCQPYSYYFPGTAKDVSDSESQAQATSSSSSESISESSASSGRLLILSAVFGFAMVL